MKLPLEYKWLLVHNFKLLTPWYEVTDEREALRKEYLLETKRDIYPIAKRQDNDDIVGFEIINGVCTSSVISTHLTWSSKPESNGFPITKKHPSIFEWLKSEMLTDTLEWISEEEINDLEKEN